MEKASVPTAATRRTGTWLAATCAVDAAVLAPGLTERLVWDDLVLIAELEPATGPTELFAPFTGDFFARGEASGDRMA